MSNLILMVIGIFLTVYVWRGVSGVGWSWPGLEELGWGGGFEMPNTSGMGNTLACKWSGSC